MTEPTSGIASDMAGDCVLARDWVFDGCQVWEVMGVIRPGQLACRDPYLVAADQVRVVLAAVDVAKVRPDRADDPRYLRAVFEQAQVLRDFWLDGQ